MNRFRQAIRRHRLLFLGFLLVETFFFVDGASIVEAQELRRQAARQELAETARVFGLSAEDLLDEPGDPLGEAVGEVRERASQAIESITERLSETLTPSSTREGAGGVSRQGHHDIASDFNRSRKLEGQEKNALAAPPQSPRPRPRLRRSAAPPRAMPALEAGEGEQTLARSLAASEKATADPAERLPLRQVERKARTIDAGSLPPTQKVTSAIAPPSAPLAAGRRAAKAIAPEIAALAASLDNSPGKIFTHVHDTITYDPKWGADSPPLGTLWEGRGTSWDQAWLLQELLIAAGVDARLEWGEVEIDTALLLEIAGVDDPIRAGDLLTTAGLPVVLIVAGSQVIAARMPHVWVKAHLDYIPNRGATAGDGDTWIRLDPSLQTFDRTDGERTDEAVSFVLGDHLQSGTEVTPRDEYEAALLAHGATLGLGTLDELKPLRAPHAEDFPFVPGTLRAKILDVAGESDVLPTSHAVRIDLELREAGGPVLASWSAPLAGVYGGLLELRWPGATSADQATLDLFGGVYGTPPYEVDLRPSLVLDGVEVATGSAIGSAEDAELAVTLTPPAELPAGDGLPIVARWELFAGEHGSLVFDFGAMPQEVVDAHLVEAATSADPTVIEAASLAAAGATYLRSQTLDLEHLAALRWHRPLNIGAAVFAVQRGAVSTNADGTPDTFSVGPLSLDVGARTLGLFPVDGVPVSTVPTMELLGAQGSIREGEALASVFGGDHVTAVGFLTLAVREGQTLTRVDATNVDAALAAATLSSDAEAAVEFAVAQGAIAWISETQLEINGWRTTGYILEDPATGAGGYFVTFERRFTPLDGAVIFHSPSDLDIVTAPTDVIATIDVEGIESWTLSTRTVGGEGTTVIATGTGPVQETLLGQFDPTLLLNGMHDIVLSGQDSAGQSVSGKITVVVEGQMKIGHFALRFVDLAVPVSGLEIEISRTYDSRDRSPHDFGYGWTLGIVQGEYRNNRPPGDGWQLLEGFLPCEVVQETKAHLTTVKLSEQELYQFKLELDRGAPTLGGCFAEASFEFLDGPLPGTTLEILGDRQVFFANGSDRVVHPDSQEDFVPRQVRLTTRDGRIFDLDLDVGVTKLSDRNGNELEITADGISHSSGRGVEFVRDTEGRIAEIIDPLGESYSYRYDSAGDLIEVEDPLGNTTRFTYREGHLLEDVIDSLGRRPVRSEYDESGRLVRQIDALGREVNFDHDLATRRDVVQDRLGGFRVLEYDERGNIVRELDELGNEILRTFDGRDNLLSQTDPLGRMTRFTYTANGDLATLVDPLGNTTLHDYDDLGRILSITDPQGGVTSFTYDSRGNLVESEDPAGNRSAFTYDSKGQVTSLADATGATTRFTYDAAGNRVREIDALGNETSWTYDAKGRILSETRQRTLADGSVDEQVSTFVYDALDREVSATTADGATTSQFYDAVGNVIQRIDPLGRLTTTEFDLLGRPILRTHPDGSRESRTYDAEGRLLTETDRGGRTTQHFYDATGRRIRTIQADGSEILSTYDAAGQLTSRTDALGRTTQFSYDAAGRRVGLVDPLGQTLSATFDANGNRLSITDPRGNTTRWDHDALGRVVATTQPDGTIVATSYDALGRRLTISDAAGRTTRFAYDTLGRLIQVTDAADQITTYAYDEANNRVAQTDAAGRTTRFEHDAVGRWIRRILPDGSIESRTFNADGTLASRTGFDGSVHTFEYDVLRQQTRWAYPGNDVSMTYTATGQLASVVDTHGTTSYVYDDLERLVSKTDANGHELRYAYDAAGNQSSLTAVVGGQAFTVQYTYDALDRVVSVEDPWGEITALGYDPSGNRTSMVFANGVETSSIYDTSNRLTERSTVHPSGATLWSEIHTLSVTGHRQRIDEHGGVTRLFTYDALDRLVQERVEGLGGALEVERTFVYDPVGNRTEQQTWDGSTSSSTLSTYDSRDRLLDAGDTDFSWDVRGNLTARVRGSEADSLTWDAADRLVSAALADGSAITTTYDAAGNRLRAQISRPDGTEQTVDYLVDTSGFLGHVVAEVVDGLLTTFYTRAGDDLISLGRPLIGETRYYHADGLGSVRALTDSSGAVTDRYTYTAFGELVEHQGDDPNPYLFAGESFDSVLGFYYNRSRWMDPSSGRFVSGDPLLGFSDTPGSLHRYLYALLDPVNRTDPTGEFSMGVNGVMVAATIGGIIGAIDAHLSGNNPAVGFAVAFVVTAVATPLIALIAAKSVFAASALLVAGFFFGGYGIGVAIREGNFELAVFRGATMVFGTGLLSSARGAVPAAFNRLRFIGSDRRLARAAQLVKPEPGKLDVVVHGGPNSVFVKRGREWLEMSHRALAALIRKNGPKKLPPIRLISCKTGSCPTGFAKNLSNKLGVDVEAPSDTLWIHPDGRMTIGPTARDNSGQWVKFSPGKGSG